MNSAADTFEFDVVVDVIGFDPPMSSLERDPSAVCEVEYSIEVIPVGPTMFRQGDAVSLNLARFSDRAAR